MKQCRHCRKRFEPTMSSLQICCSPDCAYKWAKTVKGKEYVRKAVNRERRENQRALRTKSDWMKEAQKSFNAFIRARDSGEPCISCGRPDPHEPNTRDCSHYRSVGSAPELRFEETNAHASCKYCNRYLSGNIVEYRIRLKEKIGSRKLAWLEGPHNPLRLTVEDIKGIIKTYQQKKKELRNDNSDN